jgi:hypothetical protein
LSNVAIFDGTVNKRLIPAVFSETVYAFCLNQYHRAMRKHLLIVALLGLLSPLAAENLTICQAFEKLLNHATDFKPLMGEKMQTIHLKRFQPYRWRGQRLPVLSRVWVG